MAWDYQYNPAIWPSVFTIAILTLVSVYTWHRHSLPGALWLVFYCLFGQLSLTAKIIEYLAVDIDLKVYWFTIEYPWWIPGTTALTCFILEYAWPKRWVTPWTLVGFSIVPVLTVALLLTNDLHHLLFTGLGFIGDVVPLYGAFGWFFLIYNMGLRVVSIIALVLLCDHSPQHRWPAVMILLAETLVGVLVIMDPFIEESVVFYVPEKAIPAIACAVALFTFRIFDPIPLARQTAIEQMQAGMLVLDLQGRVMSLNPAAERIINAPANQVRGKQVSGLLPGYPVKCLADSNENEIELGIGEGTTIRYYMLSKSLLKDFRGLEVGCLLLFQDMTEQKRAQVQMLAQQRTRAALEERGELARELHDSIGQALATAQLQAETASELIGMGKIAMAQNTLSRLVEATQSAQIEIRQYLLGTKTLLTPEQNVFAALHQYIQQFSFFFGPPTDLVIPQEMMEQRLELQAGAQLMRIVQEALTNVRKHARARSARVMFTSANDRIQVCIEDNGVGFDVDQLLKADDQRFGLTSMRDRAESVGGSFTLYSQPGCGTRVMVELPRENAGAILGRTGHGVPLDLASEPPVSSILTEAKWIDHENLGG